MKEIKEKEDNKEIVTIDYYDKTRGMWVKVEVTKRVARFLNSNKQKMRRRQNQYNYFNVSFDLIFGDSIDNNENLLIDKSALEGEENALSEERGSVNKYSRKKLKNILGFLSANQREVAKMYCQNMSFKEIGDKLSISKQSAYERFKNAKRNILKRLES